MSWYALVFSAKKGRHNHKHCSYVIKGSKKMFWLNLIPSVLNGVSLQPRAFIPVCSSKDIIRTIRYPPLNFLSFIFLFYCPFFPVFKHELFSNSTCSSKLIHVPSNGQHTSVTAPMRTNRAPWNFSMTSWQLKPAFSIYRGLDLSCLL